MQFEWLKVFCDVARTRSFSQAAAVAVPNKVTQSAVSQIISHLEKRVGAQLIDRSTRPLQLTALGRTYYEGCRQLLEQFSELEASLRSAQARLEGSVQIAAIYSVGLSDMGQFIEQFQQREPSAEVHIEYLHPDQVYQKVQDGEADLGLVSFPRKSAKLITVPWREEPMVLACAPKHPLAQKASVTVSDLTDQGYVHFSKELVIRREVDRFLHRHGAHVRVVHEFDSIENIKNAVEIGAGIALLPEPTFRQEAASGALVARPLADAHLLRPLGVVHRRHSRLCATAQKFLDLLCGLPGANAHNNGALLLPGEPGPKDEPTPAARNGTSHAGRNGAKRPARKPAAGER